MITNILLLLILTALIAVGYHLNKYTATLARGIDVVVSNLTEIEASLNDANKLNTKR